MINSHIKNFLIQTIDAQVKHDFCNELIEAVKYHEWLNSRSSSHYMIYYASKPDIYKNVYPIGTVEFVLKSLEFQYGIKNVKPLNIPDKFMKYEFLKRNLEIYETKGEIIKPDEVWFFKDYNKIKGFTGILKYGDELPEGKYLKSDVIHIQSEWRIFIDEYPLNRLKNIVVGCCNYAGNPLIFPSSYYIKMIVDNFDYPYPYVIDVGINEEGTFIIEMHDFFSCGLYGFSEYKILPSMFIKTLNMIVKKYSDS